MGRGILASVRFLFVISNTCTECTEWTCTEWATCFWKMSLFCFSIILWSHLSRRAEFKCPVSLQVCRGDLGILEYLRKPYFSVLSPNLKHFCLRWSLHFAPESGILTAEVNVNQDWLLKARNKSKDLSICKKPLCMVCSALVNWLTFQTFLCKKEDQLFSFPPPSKIMSFTAWKAVMHNGDPKCMLSVLGERMAGRRKDIKSCCRQNRLTYVFIYLSFYRGSILTTDFTRPASPTGKYKFYYLMWEHRCHFSKLTRAHL